MNEERSIIACANCNEPLEVGWERCPACLTPTSSTGLTCPNCQAVVKAKWKECPRCHTALSGLMTPSVDEAESVGNEHPSAERIFVTEQEKGQAGMLGLDLELPIPEGDTLSERYRIIKKLGRGGFGTVYHVHDTDLDKQMALKVVVMGKGKAQRATEQLLHEFNLRERINDIAHIIRAHDPRHCEYKGAPLVLLPMELADGRGMRQWLALNPDTEKRQNAGIEFFKQACMGIKALHDAELVHLDIKPENILLVSGRAKIADFGIGRYGANQFANNPEQLLRQGIGTPQYMSPEQFQVARQKDIGPTSDIYSLGIVLFEILDGNLPFDGTPIELRDKHLNMQPPRLKGKLEKWSRIVERCLAKKVEDRYDNIERLIKDLDRVAQGSALSIDASCPECGNINSNPNDKECEKCKANLDSLFRPCPRCAKSVRLDIEKCSGCGKDVASHYLLIGRKEQIEKLKDEDPAEAIELLELVLCEGADDFQERAVELVKDLRQKQSQVSSFISDAEDAIAQGIPEEAIKAWQQVLKDIPRHRIALEQLENLKSLMEDFTGHWNKAMDLMEQAQFDDADKLLQSCLEILPRRNKVKEMLKICRQPTHDYPATFFQESKIVESNFVKASQSSQVSSTTKSIKWFKLHENFLTDITTRMAADKMLFKNDVVHNINSTELAMLGCVGQWAYSNGELIGLVDIEALLAQARFDDLEKCLKTRENCDSDDLYFLYAFIEHGRTESVLYEIQKAFDRGIFITPILLLASGFEDMPKAIDLLSMIPQKTTEELILVKATKIWKLVFGKENQVQNCISKVEPMIKSPSLLRHLPCVVEDNSYILSHLNRMQTQSQDPFDSVSFAIAWLTLFGDHREYRSCMNKAEKLSEGSFDWDNCAHTWKIYGNDDRKTMKCLRKAENCDSMELGRCAKSWIDLFRDYREARRCLVKAQDIAEEVYDLPSCAERWITLFNDKQEASSCLQRAEEKFGDKSQGLTFCAEAWKESLNNETEARRCLTKAESVASYSHDLTGCAKAWMELFDDNREARRCLDEAENRFGNSSSSFCDLAEAWMELFNDKAEARRCLTEAESAAEISWDFRDCAKQWIKILGDKDRSRRCIQGMERCSENRIDWENCAELWEELFNDKFEADRCQRKASEAD